MAIALAGACGLGVTACTAAPLSPPAADSYRAALAAADARNWPEAHRLARKSGDPHLPEIVTWLDYGHSETKASFHDIAAFIESHRDWPGITALRAQAERVMPASLPPTEVIAWFQANPAVRAEGLLRHVDALVATGAAGAAADLVRRAWIERNFTADEEADLLRRHGNLLRPTDHVARADRLIWDERLDAARRLLPLLPSDQRALADARIRLAATENGVDQAVLAVPAALQNDPGLLFERLRWRRRQNMDAEAAALLSGQPPEGPHADKWWTERHILARRAIERQDWRHAYDLVATHGQTSGLGFAQAEWLAGWLQLRRLGNPEQAFRHFDTLYRGVSTPVSLSRGAYWAGRAAETLGQSDVARQWYTAAAAHQTTYYGQLAAERLQAGIELVLPPDPVPDKASKAAFLDRTKVRIARRLAQVGRTDLAAQFLRREIQHVTTPDEHVLIAEVAAEIQRPDIGISVARQTTHDAYMLPEAGYPVLDFRAPSPRTDQALVNSIVRQESSFDPKAVSVAGARGLMQLMPATAAEVAKKLGVEHSPGKLFEPQYNVRLGSSYLGELLDRFGGSYVLAVAGYNAGPGRARSWIETFGDPRRLDADEIVDWIELIPVYETRNYVQRVLENLQVYRARLTDGGAAPITLNEDLRRSVVQPASAPIR